MNLHARIIELLKGSTQINPMRGDALLDKTGVELETLSDALDDLHGRGAINRATITKDGYTNTVLWPTGIPPRALSWKAERDAGTGTSADLAHNVQQAAEQRRLPVKNDAATPNQKSPATAPKENTMTRISRPAQGVATTTPATNRTRNTGINSGRVQQGVLEALRGLNDAVDVKTIYARLPSDLETTLRSIGKTLETLAKRGEIDASIRLHDKRHRLFYRLKEVAKDAAIAPAKAAISGCPEHAANIEKLRKIGIDDHVVDIAEKDDPRVEKAGQELAPDTAHDARIDKRERIEERASFAYYDDGALEIFQGEETVILQEKQVTRLVAFLGRIAV